MSKFEIKITVEYEPSDEIDVDELVSGLERSLNHSIENGLLTYFHEELLVEQYTAGVVHVEENE